MIFPKTKDKPIEFPWEYANKKRQENKKLKLMYPTNVSSEKLRETDKFRDRENWRWEQKYDGGRFLMFISKDPPFTRLISRSGIEYTEQFPELQNVHENYPTRKNAILDGEMIVIPPGAKDESFRAYESRVQTKNEDDIRKKAAKLPATFMAFDLLFADGKDQTEKPYGERMLSLSRTIGRQVGEQPRVKHAEGSGLEEMLEAMEDDETWEGLVGKRLGSPYVGGVGKSNDWVKFKKSQQNDVVVVGYVPSTSDTYFGTVGALACAVWDDKTGKWRYVGKISGLSADEKMSLQASIDAGGAEPIDVELPADVAKKLNTEPVWNASEGKYDYIKKEHHAPAANLVARVKFFEYTDNRMMREGKWVGERTDIGEMETHL